MRKLPVISPLMVDIDYIQDLHGYSKPWAGGTGKNIIGDYAIKSSATSTDITATKQDDGSTYVLSGTAVAQQDVYLLAAGSYAIEPGEYTVFAKTGTGIATTNNYFYISLYNGSTTRYLGAGGSYQSQTFTVASDEVIRGIFVRIGAGVNVSGKVVEPMLVKGSSATSYEPYSNICPITGWSNAKVTRTGKNILASPFRSTSIDEVVATHLGDGVYEISGQNTQNSTQLIRLQSNSNQVSLKAGHTYRLKGNWVGVVGSSSSVRVDIRGSSGLLFSEDASSYTPVKDDVGSLVLRIAANYTVPEGVSCSPCLTVDDMDTTYEPYNGITNSISLGRTVYGGTLDVSTGLLTATHGYKDLGTLTWSAYGSSFPGLFYTDALKTDIGPTDGKTIHGISSAYEIITNYGHAGAQGSATEQPNGTIRFRESDGRVYAVNHDYDSATGTQFKTVMDGVQLVYELATPQTYQLTPKEVRAVLGKNNVWADCGYVTVTVDRQTYSGTIVTFTADYYEEYTESERFQVYLGMLKRPFTKRVRLRFLNPDGSTAFALDNNDKNKRSSAFISDGSISVNLQNGTRRTATITLSNINQQFDYDVNHIWFGNEFAIDEGLVLPNGEDFYIQQGVFVAVSPTDTLEPNRRTITYNLTDKWANLDGTLHGNLEGTYEVPVSTNIFTAMGSLLLLDKGNGSVVDSTTPIFTPYYNQMRQILPDGTTVSLVDSPYTLTVESGNSYGSVILGLGAMLNAWVGYDANGALRIDPSQDDILDTDKEVMYQFSLDETKILGATYTIKNTEVYNDYIVMGEQLDDNTQPCGRAQNLDPKSDTNVKRIGRKTIVYNASGFGTDKMCMDLAEWKLKRATVLQKAVTISCGQIMHIRENGLVTIVRTDKEGSPVERHLVQAFQRPLVSTEPMSLSCVSVNDFPIATVTTWPEKTYNIVDSASNKVVTNDGAYVVTNN